MRVLLLSPYPERLRPVIAAEGDEIVESEDPIDAGSCREAAVDWIVSYGYRHIIRPPVIDALPERIVSLHISYLPWNRGAHPNLWSWIDDTPKGVTLHRIDAGIDTGAILGQARVDLTEAETLATSHAKLQAAVEALFARCWPTVRSGGTTGRTQPPGGSVHRAQEAEPVLAALPAGWDTPVVEVAALGRRLRRKA